MPVRIVLGAATPAQIALSLVLLIGSTIVLVPVGARLYAGAVLRTGARVKLRDAWRASVHGAVPSRSSHRENLRHAAGMLRFGRNPAAAVYDSIGADFFLALDDGWLNLGLWEGDGSDPSRGARRRAPAGRRGWPETCRPAATCSTWATGSRRRTS